jgi:hypothetical protein
MSLNTDKLNAVDFTPTPRTDRAWAQGYDSDYAVNGINIDFARSLELEIEYLRKCCDFDKNGNPIIKGSTLYLHSKRTDGTICEMTLPVEHARIYCWFNTIEDARARMTNYSSE